MKKVFCLVSLCLVAAFLMSSQVFAGEIKVNGSAEIQYKNSSDIYTGAGGDTIKLEEAYIKLSSEVAENVDALVKLDAADMNEAAHDSDMVEEVNITFKNIGGFLDVTFGKDEMPFGMDHDKFIYGNAAHDAEIDKAFGLNNKIKAGPVNLEFAAFVKDDTKDTAVTDSLAARLTLKDLVPGLKTVVSYAKQGKDKATAGSEDETDMSVGVEFGVAGAVIHAEYISMKNAGNAKDVKNAPTSISSGVDYKIGDAYLVRVMYDIIDDGDGTDDAGQNKNVLGVGVDRSLSENTRIGVDYIIKNYEAKNIAGNDSESEAILGVKTAF